MEARLEKLPKSRVRLTVTVSPIEMGEYFDRALRQLAVGFTIEGFRPGKVPLSIAEKKIGQERVEQEALEMAISLSYYQAIKQNKITPIGQPKLEIKEFGRTSKLLYEAEVDVMPKVELADYRQLKIKPQKSKTNVTEDDIMKVLKQLQRQTAELVPVDRTSQKGDFVEIDFKTFLEGKPIPGGESRNHPVVIGQGQFVPQFEEKLVGLRKGESRQFSIKFADDFHNKEIAGKEVDFEVTVKELKEIKLPKINDEWAKKLGKASLADLKKSISESLQKEAERKDEEKLRQEIIDKIVDNSSVEIPESLILAERDRLFQTILEQIERSGMDFDQYVKKLKKTKEKLMEDLLQTAKQNVKIGLVLDAIREKENIRCLDEELNSEIEKLKAQNITVSEEVAERIKNMLEMRKTVERLREIVVSEK